MPVSFNQVASDEASVSFPCAGDTLTVVYYPSRISEKMLRKLSKSDTSDLSSILDGLESLNEMLVKIIKSWDFFKDDAQTVMWPIDEESFSELPMKFKQDVLLKIAENMGPNSQAA